MSALHRRASRPALAMTLCVIAFIVSACGNQSGADPSQPSVPTVSLAAPSAPVNLGETFSSSVEVHRLGDTFYAAFDVTYDPDVLQFQDATDGTFLSHRGTQATLVQTALQDGAPGRIAVGISRVAQTGGMAGGGTLLSLSFKAVGSGTTRLAFASPKVLRSSDHRDVTVEVWQDGVVTVR